jgi:hypothetical protein
LAKTSSPFVTAKVPLSDVSPETPDSVIVPLPAVRRPFVPDKLEAIAAATPALTVIVGVVPPNAIVPPVSR